MIKTRSSYATAILVVLLGWPVVAVQAAYSLTDLQGEWALNILGSTGWWERGSGTINADGAFTFSAVTSSATTDSFSGVLNISAIGIITPKDDSFHTLQCSLDTGKTVFVCTRTFTDNNHGAVAIMMIATKQAPSYAQSDLMGTGRMYAIASGPKAPWWEHSLMTIDNTGVFSLTGLLSNGSSDSGSGTMTVSAAGSTTLSVNPTFLGAMDAGKTIGAGTAKFQDGSTQLSLLMKMASSYSQADLTGTWGYSALNSGANNAWKRGILTVGADGTVSGTKYVSDGSTQQVSGTWAISANDGVMTKSNNPGLFCTLDADKTIISCVETLPDGTGGTAELVVMTKQQSSGLVTGDANADGKINSLDLIATANQILGIANEPGTPDCNQDSKVNSLDLICIANKILGL